MKGKRQRAAIYTRKSTEAGLEQDFNSLDAQREACEAYIKSQAHEGWKLLPQCYDDGGLSGGTLDRPALQRLLTDIEAGLVDVIVVYKVDRLTRSLIDFAKLVERFDTHGVSFVSITQQFNTTSSMGRLTLNVLLSFAQFEREVTAERIRDKIAASKAKGIWMGGPVPLGYDLGDRELLVNPTEAELVREIFELYLEKGSVRTLKTELDRRGMRSKVRHQRNGRVTGGGPFSRGHLYCLLANPIYIGKLPHKGKLHDGRHQAIIDEGLWERVQGRLRDNKRGIERASAKHPSLLAGRLETSDGQRLIPSHAVKRGRRYRYYIEQRLVQDEGVGTKGVRYAAEEVEKAVLVILRRFLNSPADMLAALAMKDLSPGSLKRIVGQAKALADDLKDHHTAHQISSEVIDKVIIHQDALELRLQREKLAGLLGAESRSEDPVYVITSPCKLARRGQDLKFILPLLEDSNAFSRQDPALIQAVAKAHLWWDWIKEGEVKSLSEIAQREGIDKAQVTRWLRLAFLSPTLVRQIRAGAHPTSLTIESLTRQVDLPTNWQEQEALVAALG
ncbi:MAG: recombinase family protein [Gemmatimonadetes bacterium]|nr:recombinase family protein [Gemmatimonadota bacterium]